MNRTHLLALLPLALLNCEADPAASGAGGDDPPAVDCPAPAGPGAEHSGTIAADESWAAADGPHLVTFDVAVAEGATLTLEPCTQVRVGGGYTIVVRGSLVAEGTATRPIQLMADDPAEPWGFLQVFAPGTIRLAHVTLDDAGGEPSNSYAALEARGDQLLPAQEILHVDTVSIRRSASVGVSLRSGAAFTADSRELVVTGSADAPLRILPRLATNLPTGSYTGNGLDAIVVETEAYGDVGIEDVTLRNRGVPYRIGGPLTDGRFVVRGEPGKVTLSIEPGVTLQFKENEAASLVLESPGSDTPASAVLVARGTAEQPIVFTSASNAPVAGAWQGLVFGGLPDPGNVLEHAEVRFAGGPSRANSFHCEPDGSISRDEDAAISLYGQPATAFVGSTLISDSASRGVNLAYSGDFVDFQPSNEFVNVPGCKVSWPRGEDGSCPASSTCP